MAGKFEKPKEYFLHGHRSCAGCGPAVAMRQCLQALGDETVVVNATGCMEVVSTQYPESSWNLPYIHSLFENVPSVASGVSRAFKKLGKKGVVVGIGGDGACYSPDTKILTADGFKWVADVSTKDILWSVNPDTFELELQPVEKLHQYFFEGKMVRANTRYVDFLVTSNHNIPAMFRKSGKIVFLKAEELLKKYKTLLPRSFKWHGEKKDRFVLPKLPSKTSMRQYSSFDAGDWAEFVGWYVTEGSCYHSDSGYLVRIYQSNKKNRKHILQLVRKMGLRASECSRSVDISSKQLFTCLKNTCGDYFYNKRIPKDVLSLSSDKLLRLFDAMIRGDGCKVRPGKGRTSFRTTFITKSSYLVSQFTELCLKLGKGVHITYDNRRIARIGVQEKHVKNELYSTRKFSQGKTQVFEEDYEGIVYCPQLPKNHTLIIERNGKVSLSGNSYDIGFGALSGAMERNEDMIYIAYDNECYANTGVQRSGATPIGAVTTTSPAEIHGKAQWKKNLPFIAAAHAIPYVATSSIAFIPDLKKKLQKAKEKKGFRLVHVHAPCPLGWRFDSGKTIEVARLAVRCGLWNLFEIENGLFKQSMRFPKLVDVEDYLKLQGRFKILDEQQLKQIKEHLARVQTELKKLEDAKLNLEYFL
ncbi:MAG: thiamine pyrophosphate-dependent enzyme [Candidatus Micrarchaeia archaeon]